MAGQFGASLQLIERVTEISLAEFAEMGPEDRAAIENVRERMGLPRIPVAEIKRICRGRF
jgi:hypothetical protein